MEHVGNRYDSSVVRWRFPSDSISTMLRKTRKDESIRGSAERPKGLREEYSKLSLHHCRYTGKYRGQDAVLWRIQRAPAKCGAIVNDRGISSYLLFVGQIHNERGATPQLFSRTRHPSRVKENAVINACSCVLVCKDGYTGRSRERSALFQHGSWICLDLRGDQETHTQSYSEGFKNFTNQNGIMSVHLYNARGNCSLYE